ncbi:hypothetical protein PIB30_023386 [Stylosanthes scabra]|uniref:Uncharacterized protein n=1 Tax=Stylosanthes scabra TaxID=79078 RepID=A0ABU6VB13_9FABA|nr:hypothetical protein [Stylosanthes scabra]
MVHNEGVKEVKEDENEKDDEEEKDDWLYDLLAELANSDDEDDVEEEEVNEKEDEEETFFIGTLYGGGKVMKEDMHVKCEDPSPCLVTCKIRGVEILDCMCNLVACGMRNIIEVFHLTRPPASWKKGAHQVKLCNEEVRRNSFLGKVEGKRTGSPKGEVRKGKGLRNAPPKFEKKKKKEPLKLVKKRRRGTKRLHQGRRFN